MRIRQVKPEFWSDADMAELAPPVRLTYIGLWCESDDTGWFVADVPQIAHDLYGYAPRVKREATLVSHLVSLQEAGKVIVECCGHALIPTLADHQRQAAATRRVETVKREHALCLSAERSGTPLNAADFRPVSVEVRNVEERNVSRAGAREGSVEPTTSEFVAKVARPA